LDVNEPLLKVARYPRNARCAITTSWDDNDCKNLEITNILDSVKMKGTFYVDPGAMFRKRNVYLGLNGKPRAYKDGLSDTQLRLLAKNHEVCSHTWSHPIIARCDAKKLRQELIMSKEYIEGVLGRPVLGVAYPQGVSTPLVERISRECGYLFARTTDQGHVEFPPPNPYQWGISVFAIQRNPYFLRWLLSKRRILSRVGNVYVKNLAFDWRKLSLRLFQRALAMRGVLHINGHASEALKPKLRSQFLNLCHHLALRDDVWYATNGMLFLNENVRRSVQITHVHHDNEFVFRVKASPSPPPSLVNTPIPLLLETPKLWQGNFEVQVNTSTSGRAEMRKFARGASIDIFDDEAMIAVSRT
jgi:peptidoglycan/xylan/chitin deacetylase (PgdA/CDA1 family)